MTSTLAPRNYDETYSFVSQPKVVQKRKAFQEKKVIRGNTYALHILPSNAQPDPIEIQKQIERKKRALARRKIKEQLQPKSPLPLEGKINQPVQTELYLEALTAEVEEADIDCQTDAFLDRPPTPLYVPSKTGVDCETQILDGELFHFDLEVTSILEVLIGKTIEQSLLEVMEEEELANIRKQKNIFNEIREADLMEVHRLAERQRRISEEKERRKKQYLEAVAKEREVADKVASHAFAKAYLADLQPSVFNNLTENGYFYDPIERDIEDGFLPWLMNEIEEEMEMENNSRLLLDAMIRQVVQERHHEYRQLELKELEKELMQNTGAALIAESNEPTLDEEVITPEEVKQNAPIPAEENDEQIEPSERVPNQDQEQEETVPNENADADNVDEENEPTEE